jgi:NAD(P)H dehydrogenase (quinone)
MTTYAVTGVTGRFGRVAVKTLAELVPAENIVALARNTEKAAEIVPAGVTVRPGDYAQPEALAASLQGVDRLLFVSSIPSRVLPRIQQHQNIINAAKQAGVSYIAYTSFPHADTATVPLAKDHRETEQAISAAGLAHSFLRNNWYLENEADFLRAGAAGEPFVYSAGEGKAGYALEREYAEAAARVLAAMDPKEIYEFAGTARTYRELAEAVPGQFPILAVTDDEFTDRLVKTGMNPRLAQFMTATQAMIRAGVLAEDTTDLPDVLGRPLTPLAEAIQEVLQK